MAVGTPKNHVLSLCQMGTLAELGVRYVTPSRIVQGLLHIWERAGVRWVMHASYPKFCPEFHMCSTHCTMRYDARGRVMHRTNMCSSPVLCEKGSRIIVPV